MGRGALRCFRSALADETGNAVCLRRLEPAAGSQVRFLRQAGEGVRRRAAVVSARSACRSLRQCVGHRRPWKGRQGPPGVQVRPRRQGSDDAGQGRRGRRRTGRIQRPVGGVGGAERRHLRRRRPRRKHQRAHREVHQGRQVHQDVGQEGLSAGASSTFPTRWRWIRAAGCSSPIARTTAFRSSTRTETTSTSGSSSVGRAGFSSTRTT